MAIKETGKNSFIDLEVRFLFVIESGILNSFHKRLEIFILQEGEFNSQALTFQRSSKCNFVELWLY